MQQQTYGVLRYRYGALRYGTLPTFYLTVTQRRIGGNQQMNGTQT